VVSVWYLDPTTPEVGKLHSRLLFLSTHRFFSLKPIGSEFSVAVSTVLIPVPVGLYRRFPLSPNLTALRLVRLVDLGFEPLSL
jgi:hypothetical protein